MKAKVQVHRYLDNSLAVFHGPRLLAKYDTLGALKEEAEASTPRTYHNRTVYVLQKRTVLFVANRRRTPPATDPQGVASVCPKPREAPACRAAD